MAIANSIFDSLLLHSFLPFLCSSPVWLAVCLSVRLYFLFGLVACVCVQQTWLFLFRADLVHGTLVRIRDLYATQPANFTSRSACSLALAHTAQLTVWLIYSQSIWLICQQAVRRTDRQTDRRTDRQADAANWLQTRAYSFAISSHQMEWNGMAFRILGCHFMKLLLNRKFASRNWAYAAWALALALPLCADRLTNIQALVHAY